MDIDKFISYQIERQFPSIYIENGSELVDLVKAYYLFLESDVAGYYVTGYTITGNDSSERQYFANKFPTYSAALAYQTSLQSLAGFGDLKIVGTKNNSVFHNRRLFEYNDIDDTLNQMLLFYKNKYLNDLPFDESNIRFAVKHILDLYRRKGSKEGLLLFFRLFYSQNVDVYYPSRDILKPSSSRWKAGQYIELYPQDPAVLSNLRGLAIYGSVSGATAIVDRVSFSVIDNTLVPIINLSNVKGNFVGFDAVTHNGVSYGIVRGSLQTVTISNTDVRTGTSNNFVGDVIDVTSATGFGGKARVSRVTSESSGEIDFVVSDGGFGYTTTNTDIIISDQVVFINNPSISFEPLETVNQVNTGALGIIVGQRLVSSGTLAVGVLLSSSNTFAANAEIATIDRDVNISENIVFSSPRNNTASASMGSTITNVRTISIITDLIEDYLNVPLNSTNYSTVPPAVRPMSGNAPFGDPPITLSTPIEEAFVFQTFEIGTITDLTGIDPGADYVNDVFVIARENVISRFDLANQLITFDSLTGVNIEVGTIVVQNDPAINTENLDIRGIVRGRSGNAIEVMQLSFQGFTSSNSMFVEGSTTPVPIVSVQRNYGSRPLGLNAQIDGFVSASVGKVQAVEVFDSGIGFIDNVPVSMKNVTKIERARSLLESALNNPSATPLQITQLQDMLTYWQNTVVATGTGRALGQGKTEGVWESRTSHLNSRKVIQDSDFYQDFSYQVTSKLSPAVYEKPLKDLAHVAGTKVFHKFSLQEDINIQLDTSLNILLYQYTPTEVITESSESMTTEDGSLITGLQATVTILEG